MNIGCKIYVWLFGAHEAEVVQIHRTDIFRLVKSANGDDEVHPRNVSHTKTADVTISIKGKEYPLDTCSHWAYTFEELCRVQLQMMGIQKLETSIDAGLRRKTPYEADIYELAYKEAFALLMEVIATHSLKDGSLLRNRIGEFINRRIGPLQ